MIATLATIGTVHGGNGGKAAGFLMDIFANSKLADPYSPESKKIVIKAAADYVKKLSKIKQISKETDIPFERVPCLGHPVYRNEVVNYDPREQVLTQYLEKSNIYHAFFDFYHELAANMQKEGITGNVLAVNIDAAIACVWLGICWPLICDKKMTIARAKNIPFLAFALGRAAGGAAEYLDHTDYGALMDMRVPVSECEILNLPK
jgi:citrate synthase